MAQMFLNTNPKIDPTAKLFRKKDESEESAIERLSHNGWVIEEPYYWEGHVLLCGDNVKPKVKGDTIPSDDEDHE